MEKVVCPYLDIIGKEDKPKKVKNGVKKEESDDNVSNNSGSELDDMLIKGKNIDKLDKDEKKEKVLLKLASKKVMPSYNFVFQLPKDILVIFDEAHRCKNYKSLTSKLLLSIISSGNKIMLLSATISDKVCFKPFGVAFGFYENVKMFKIWIRRQIAGNKKKYGNRELNDDLISEIINNNIFPKKGSRIKICELGDLFPQNQVKSNLYFCNNYGEIQKQYQIIKDAYDEYKKKEKKVSFPLAKILYARMQIEQFKIPIFIDLANEALDNKYSVVIFVCFKETMYNLSEQLKTDCLIHGEQSLDERKSCIADFQSNKCKVIICMISAGNVGISLHDIHGGHPRMSLISPSWSGIEMRQALGRIHRAGAKTPAFQRIIYCAKTYEEEICKLIEKKLAVIDKINNGILVVDEIDMEVMKEIENKEGENKIFESICSTKDIADENKKEIKEQILGVKKNFSEYYKSGIKDADIAKEKIDKMKSKKIKKDKY
jgi:hypothetical protein